MAEPSYNSCEHRMLEYWFDRLKKKLIYLLLEKNSEKQSLECS